MSKQAKTPASTSTSAVDLRDTRDRYEIELPHSKRKAQILKRITGRHVELACRLLPQPQDAQQMHILSMALIAVCVRVDGAGLAFEDVRSLHILDVMRLIGEGLIVGGKGDAPPEEEPAAATTSPPDT